MSTNRHIPAVYAGTAAERGAFSPGPPGLLWFHTDVNDALAIWNGTDWNLRSPVDVYLDDGTGDSPSLRFVGGSNDDTIRFQLADDAAAGRSDLDLFLADDAGQSYLRVKDSGGVIRAWVDSDGDASFNGTMTVGVGGPTGTYLNVGFAAVNTTTSTYGISASLTKTAGVTDHLDELIALRSLVELNQAAGVVGQTCALYGRATLTAGDIGTAGNPRDMVGVYGWLDLDAGTVRGDAYGIRSLIDQEAGSTAANDVFGIHVDVDADGTVTGTAYMLYLNEQTGVDFGVYQNGTAVNYLGGRLGIGINAPTGQLHANQSAAAGAIPTLHLEQDDESEEFVRLTGQTDNGVLTNSLVKENDVTTATRAGFWKVYVVDEDATDPIADGPYFVPIFTLA